MTNVRFRGPAALLLATAGLLLAAPGPGQTPQQPTSPVVLPAPPALLQAFDAIAGTVQQLAVPPQAAGATEVEVVLAGATFRLALHEHDVRAPNYQLLVRDAAGIRPVPAPPSVTWQGEVANDPGSAVAATIVGGSLTAYVVLSDGQLWVVQPVREVNPTAGAALHVVFRGSDSVNLPVGCGLVANAPAVVPDPGSTDVLHRCDLAIEADYPYYQANGSNLTNTQNDVTGIVNAMDVIYRRDVNITFSVPTMIVNQTTDAYTSSSASTLLTQFTNRWNSVHAGVGRDVAHLFTGRPMGQTSGGAIGIAFLGTVCILGNAYGVSQSRFSTNYNWRVAVTAHEIGHNFGAGHCNASSPCHIMCSGVGGCSNVQTSFAATEQNQINAYRATISCLTPQSTAPAITGATPTSVKTFYPAQVTLAGSGFTGVNAVTVGTLTVNTGIVVVSDTQMRFTPPSGVPLGIQLMSVTNPSGTSNSWPLIVNVTDPCEMRVPGAALGGTSLVFEMGGRPSDAGFLLVSLLNTTSPFMTGTLLDGHSLLWSGTLDARGLSSFSIPLPIGVLNGLRVYSQFLDADLTVPVLRSSSAVLGTFVIG